MEYVEGLTLHTASEVRTCALAHDLHTAKARLNACVLQRLRRTGRGVRLTHKLQAVDFTVAATCHPVMSVQDEDLKRFNLFVNDAGLLQPCHGQTGNSASASTTISSSAPAFNLDSGHTLFSQTLSSKLSMVDDAAGSVTDTSIPLIILLAF